ncbi:MAG: hypothetical protein ABL933_05130 [Methyloglobulus sp.]|nr:hypothetical protein [Methyloglobulus sp.]
MNQENFGGTVIPAMAGFFLFGKRAKVQEIQGEKPKQLPAVIKADMAGLTGVAKYLISVPLVTGVAKYLKKNDNQPISSVQKYVLKQMIAERNAPSVTGVAKYLDKAGKQIPARKKSGVDRYITKQELASRSIVTLTGVARYEAEQTLIEKRQAAAAMIKKYRDEEDAAREAKNIAQATSLASADVSTQNGEAIEAVSATRVGRYLQEQNKLAKSQPKVTGVCRYLAKQIILESQKPTLSKVEKYLRGQAVTLKKKPNLTGVARYLSKQHTEVTPKAKTKLLPASGVARYLQTQSIGDSKKTVLSGVAKYMEKLADLDVSDKNILAIAIEAEIDEANDHIPTAVVEECLEGEFIPAHSFPSLSGVEKYLDKQTVREENVVEEVLTGVSRYLKQQLQPLKQTQALPLRTGVDKYLSNRA